MYLYTYMQVIMENHRHSQEYTLGSLTPGYEAYRSAHDRLVDQKVATTTEALQGIYAKARGYVTRLAMILTVLEQAVEISISGGEPQIWDTDITVYSVQAAEAIIQHLNTQKEIMMGIDTGEKILGPNMILTIAILQLLIDIVCLTLHPRHCLWCLT